MDELELLLGYLLGLMTAGLIAAILRQETQAPPPPTWHEEDTLRRETHNFLHYDGED